MEQTKSSTFLQNKAQLKDLKLAKKKTQHSHLQQTSLA
jgi:hypothetical protein